METKLYNTELEEALISDKMDSLTHRLNRATLLLEATVHYVHCLDMKERATLRLTQLAARFIHKDLNPTETLNQYNKVNVKCYFRLVLQLWSVVKRIIVIF